MSHIKWAHVCHDANVDDQTVNVDWNETSFLILNERVYQRMLYRTERCVIAAVLVIKCKLDK